MEKYIHLKERCIVGEPGRLIQKKKRYGRWWVIYERELCFCFPVLYTYLIRSNEIIYYLSRKRYCSNRTRTEELQVWHQMVPPGTESVVRKVGRRTQEPYHCRKLV